MHRLWLFNLENDIALANGTANFTPPPAAVEMRRAGELLPLFLADENDRIFCNGVNDKWFEDFRQRFGIRTDIWNHDCKGFRPTPWGWSKAAKRIFENLGFAREFLPSDEELDSWRTLSHRRTAAEISELLAQSGKLDLWPASVEINEQDSLEQVLKEYRHAVIKQPWSSSGRGVKVFDIDRHSIKPFIEQAAGTIHKQGSIMVERFMQGHKDFALLYECRDKKATFEGVSVFIADSSGNYLGNLVDRQESLRQNLSAMIGKDSLDVLIAELQEAVSEIIAPEYSGPVGIDICYADGKVHVCEANLRYTMGFVAKGIAAHIGNDSPKMLSVSNIKPEGAIALTPPGVKMSFYLSDVI